MNKEKNVQDSQVARHSSNEMCADVLCQILVDDKIRGIYLHSHQCTKKAVCVIAFNGANTVLALVALRGIINNLKTKI